MSLIVSMYSIVGSFIHSLQINVFTLNEVALNLFVLLPFLFPGNIAQIPIKESGKWPFTIAIACVNSKFAWSLSSLHFENALSMHWSMLFRVAPDIDAFMKLSSNAPSRTLFNAPNSILTALIVLVSLLSPSLLSTFFVCDVCCTSRSGVFLPSIISGA